MSKNVNSFSYKRAREADESIGEEIKKVSFCLSLYSLNLRVSFIFPNFSSTFLLTPSQKAMAELVDEDGKMISVLPSDGNEKRIFKQNLFARSMGSYSLRREVAK